MSLSMSKVMYGGNMENVIFFKNCILHTENFIRHVCAYFSLLNFMCMLRTWGGEFVLATPRGCTQFYVFRKEL